MKESLDQVIADSSISDLEALQKDIASAIEARKEKEVNDARIHVRELAASLGISLEELIAEPTKPNKKAVKKAEVKYRNPENHEQSWTGRGLKPKWLVAAIEAGATLESFAV